MRLAPRPAGWRRPRATTPAWALPARLLLALGPASARGAAPVPRPCRQAASQARSVSMRAAWRSSSTKPAIITAGGITTHDAARWATAIAAAPAVIAVRVTSMRRRARRTRSRRSAAAGLARPPSSAWAPGAATLSPPTGSSSASARSSRALAATGSARLLSSVPEAWGGRSHRGTRTMAQIAMIARYRIALLNAIPRARVHGMPNGPAQQAPVPVTRACSRDAR